MTEEEIVGLCRDFARQADALETKGFNDIAYQQQHFVQDFNALFARYAHGNNSRVSSLNFRQPPRYAVVQQAQQVTVTKKHASRYEVTFEGERPHQAVRFVVEKKEGGWKLVRYKTRIGLPPKDSFRNHKL